MIDADLYHHPDTAPDLIAQALKACDGDITELARKVGVTRQYLRKLYVRDSVNMSYQLQVTLERIIEVG